jgi:hypothetical protein
MVVGKKSPANPRRGNWQAGSLAVAGAGALCEGAIGTSRVPVRVPAVCPDPTGSSVTPCDASQRPHRKH